MFAVRINAVQRIAAVLVVLVRADSASTLRDAATKHSLLIGAATNDIQLRRFMSEPQYKELAKQQFSLTVAESSCRMGAIHPKSDSYNFAGCDNVMQAAREARQRVRQQLLHSHSQSPAWLDASMSQNELIVALESHISTVVGRYADTFAWDVVSGAVVDGTYSDSGASYSDSVVKSNFAPWMPHVPDFIDRAFRAARSASPKSKLVYNDYGAEAVNAKSDRVLALMRGLQQRGVPVDAVGFQMRIDTDFLPLLPSVRENFERFAAQGLEIHITELEVRTQDSSAASLAQQAEVYAGILQICLAVPQCTVMSMWGFTDRHTKTGGSPLPFDADYRPKPAFHQMLDVLATTPVSPSRASDPALLR